MDTGSCSMVEKTFWMLLMNGVMKLGSMVAPVGVGWIRCRGLMTLAGVRRLLALGRSDELGNVHDEADTAVVADGRPADGPVMVDERPAA
jgi:hypothetical protein